MTSAEAPRPVSPPLRDEEILSSPLTQDMLQTLPGPPLQPSPLLITQTFPGTSPSMLVARGSAPQCDSPQRVCGPAGQRHSRTGDSPPACLCPSWAAPQPHR
ncbi:hypothetical protein JZ751_006435 [Albula glossodonta]|uniref:Uncharacterized protein n=1 Tax=Albula glossodonta TaxID=121402 RepID=A0A8T2MTF7_9TELE|nr:hypothetical protein JZ751_006435 [Albula glossodonta]